MADVEYLPPRGGSKRPTIKDPVLVDRHLRRIDALIALLAQVRGSLSLQFSTASIVDADTVTAVEELHTQLQEQHELLCALL